MLQVMLDVMLEVKLRVIPEAMLPHIPRFLNLIRSNSMPNAPVAAAAPGLPSYTTDDAAADLSNLAHLIDAIVDIAQELPRPADKLDVASGLNRIVALGHIGSETAQRIAEDLANLLRGERS